MAKIRELLNAYNDKRTERNLLRYAASMPNSELRDDIVLAMQRSQQIMR